jgi:hypothetical protein
MVTACVLNQFHRHWLLNDALHFAISLSLKLLKNNEVQHSFDNLMEDEYGLANELALLSSNIKNQVYGVLDFFLSFLMKYEEKQSHNMIST